MECPHGKEQNPKTGRCVKKCPAGKERNPKTGRCVRTTVQEDQIMTQKLRQDLFELLAELRRPRLADMFQKSIDPTACLRKVATDELEAQLQRRRRPVNVIVPKRKKK